MVRTLWHKLFSQGQSEVQRGDRWARVRQGLRKPRRCLPARYVPVLHALEDRCLLSTFHEYAVPDNGFGVNLTGITAGPDGNVWFTNAGDLFRSSRGEIESITPTGTITTFPQPLNTQPTAIVTGADGNLWYGGHFPESFDHAVIGRITTDCTATRFLLPPRLRRSGFRFSRECCHSRSRRQCLVWPVRVYSWRGCDRAHQSGRPGHQFLHCPRPFWGGVALLSGRATWVLSDPITSSDSWGAGEWGSCCWPTTHNCSER